MSAHCGFPCRVQALSVTPSVMSSRCR
ncbi:hypothetical protein AvCA_29420 [Azotobacter vinelandii CA]|uniref:Uncharacterized protein n=2 Tax=Azotobacter vinelandii TaxID=354 RepID=C1DM22_AZOVD|nr:hypothetical protein Avin_29420 [Azotobacter vinelandii DJ]AGK16496.1 hypothetical protein AvCA_29420 [Azotobacter vinelandii CA]AGK20977.1 hypothetical protein AvCA6_29420 [Azotobacter vinelandii CA6]